MDGSSIGNPSLFDFGSIIRDHSSNWVLGYKGHLELSTNIHAELETVQSGIALAWRKGICVMHVETDCMDVIHLLNSNKSDTHKLGSLIHDIKWLINKN
ncbi:hypothetical protein L6164_026289 [Bauhinia variegata]|uniref:Uncharacterized protein n=1 Tax=Bauhinia variegata TaxID=167791 RepID=A0ACB9LQH7_BAUVA|nr:hypothetical protein L6164_026289 [Bauhinia variegata]